MTGSRDDRGGTVPVRTTRVAMSGGVADFRWAPCFGGLFTFEAVGFHGECAAQALAWYSMYVVTGGSVTLRRGDEAWTATPGMVILLPPDEIHARQFAGREGCFIEGVFPTAKALALMGHQRLVPDLHFRSAVVDDPVLATHILSATGAVRSGRGVAETITRVVDHVASHHRRPDPVRPRREHRAVHITKAYLKGLRGEIPSMRALAGIASLSRFHLSRVFRDSEGLSPYGYYEQLRLGRARYLIHAGAPLSQVTFAAGYTDQSHFSRQFKANLLMTPGTYARAVRMARQEGQSIPAPGPDRRSRA